MKVEAIKTAFPETKIKLNEPLAKYSFTKTGGPADAIVFPKSETELKEIIDWVRQHDLPLLVLGNLSNLIVRDGGIRGVVIILTEMNAITVDGSFIEAESGASLIKVTQTARDASLTGLEFACGIPGSVGGAIYMNAGAYGGEMVDLPIEIDTITRHGEFKTYTTEQADFSYRHSVFQENGDIILRVRYELKQGDQDEIEAEIARLTHLRESKQPLEYPSCGSVFKRPVGYFAGKLIQDAGLQGYRVGGVEVSKKHAGFMVNIDGGTATDYVNLIEHVQKTILEKDGVVMETEVKIIGEV